MSLLKQRLMDMMYVQEWWSEVRETSGNRLYKHVEVNFGYESYLDLCSASIRIALTKLRLSSHVFLVERGRWKKIALEERVCMLCNVVEDEFHCLIECPRFNKQRMDDCLPLVLKYRPSMFEFIFAE